MQLDLFERDEVKLLMREIAEVRERADNVRRGLFARHNELARLYLELRQEVDALKSIAYKKTSSEMVELFTEKVS